MKLSLAWIFDHIQAPWQDQDITALMATFNQVTAEIEHFYTLQQPLEHIFLATIQRVDTVVHVAIPELNSTIQLPLRDDLTSVVAGPGRELALLVWRENDAFRWASLQDFGYAKQDYFPVVSVRAEELAGLWRTLVSPTDVILEVDNKSITHRPDMWGHRGFAREIAAFLRLPLRPSQEFLKKIPVTGQTDAIKASSDSPISLTNKIPELCKKFNGLYISHVENRASSLYMALRLLAVDQRPINLLVDITNYLMLDWAQPVHVYDAATIADQAVVIRMARAGEELVLLDNTVLKLTDQDMVIANAQQPMCLAGVKGGKLFSINESTHAVFFESACFDAGMVRRAALRHKIRTDSSARFEKTLAPAQSEEAVYRFLALADAMELPLKIASHAVAVGHDDPVVTIRITHDFIEKKSGITFTSQTIIALLSRLEFLVEIINQDPCEYAVTVPAVRASKDIKIKEDIFEEIIRSYGYGNITPTLPTLYRRPFELTGLRRLRKLKQYLACRAGMTEMQNYAFYDEQFLAQLMITAPSAVAVVNPVSENYKRMVASLLPGLWKNICDNHVHREALAFFECGRVWSADANNAVAERKALAGIIFEKRKKIDFYQAKEMLIQLFKVIEWDIRDVRFEKVAAPTSEYYKPYQTMAVYVRDSLIGYAGIVNPLFAAKLDIIATCDAFVFELDITDVLSMQLPAKKFVPFSKFQDVYFDMSVVLPFAVTAAQCIELLNTSVSRAYQIELIDLFEKDEWDSARALTFRVWLSDASRTLTKADIDAAWVQAKAAIESLGAQLRA